jgi:cytochrome P450
MNAATEQVDLPATLLLDASVIDDPYPFYRRLVAEAPVWCIPDTEIVIVSSYDAVTEVVLLSAGGESTTSLLDNAIHLLALNPGLQGRLRDEPQLVAPFVEEALRLEPPFRYHLRHATRATDVHGVPIAAGSTVLLFWGAANRDPAEYDRPDDVLLDRSAPKHHLAFGRGIHFCVGAPLARLEAQIVLTRLLARTRRFALDPDRPTIRVDSLVVRRFRSLPLVVAASR